MVKNSHSLFLLMMTINSKGEVISESEILIKNERGEAKLARVK
jgi:hypothetical protein